jgi:pyruvate/2-oxoglutarate dehydrogenase complex dihydrolipoamide acyltransferase (E2) component
MPRPILPRRIPAATLDSILTLISEGWQTTEDAFMEAGISRFAVQYALRDGRAADEKWESGTTLTAAESELRGFYLKVEEARAKQNAVLRRLSFGAPKIPGDITCNPKEESPAALRVYVLTCRALRTPWRDPDELAAIAAHAAASAGKPTEEPTAEATPQPTEAQRTALARKLAAELGYDLVPRATDAG